MAKLRDLFLAPYEARAGERRNISAEANRMLDLHGIRAHEEAIAFAKLFDGGPRTDLATYWRWVAASITFKTRQSQT